MWTFFLLVRSAQSILLTRLAVLCVMMLTTARILLRIHHSGCPFWVVGGRRRSHASIDESCLSKLKKKRRDSGAAQTWHQSHNILLPLREISYPVAFVVVVVFFIPDREKIIKRLRGGWWIARFEYKPGEWTTHNVRVHLSPTNVFQGKWVPLFFYFLSRIRG